MLHDPDIFPNPWISIQIYSTDSIPKWRKPQTPYLVSADVFPQVCSLQYVEMCWAMEVYKFSGHVYYVL